jgi:hypothetical protein
MPLPAQLRQHSDEDRSGQPESRGSISGWHLFLFSPLREIGSAAHLACDSNVRGFVPKYRVTKEGT